METGISVTGKIEALYALYEQELFRVCFAVLGDSYLAEDALSESFLKLIRLRDKIGDVKSPATRRLVIKIAKNTAIDYYRKNKRELEHACSLPERESYEMSLEQDFDGVFAGVGAELLNKLDGKYRAVVECICIENLSVRETAAILRISESCVRKRLERAREKLRAQLGRKS